MNDTEKRDIYALILAGDEVMKYREHLSNCEFSMTEFCTCGRKQAADTWRRHKKMVMEIYIK